MSATLDQLRASKPRSNMFHNLIHAMAIKLDSAARYSIYINDAEQESCHDCVEVWQKCRELEMQQIQLIERELNQHFLSDRL